MRDGGEILPGAFTPECKEDGSYSEVQCRSTGYCWCVDGEGDEVVGSKVKFGRPNCTEGKMYHTVPYDHHHHRFNNCSEGEI